MRKPIFLVDTRMLLQNCFQPIAQTCRSAKFFGQNVWSTLGLQGGWRQNSNWKMAAIIHCTLLILYNQVREDYFDDIFEARRPITNIPSHDERIVRCLQLWSFFYFWIIHYSPIVISDWYFLFISLFSAEKSSTFLLLKNNVKWIKNQFGNSAIRSFHRKRMLHLLKRDVP